jgi:Mitochondrial genome maintenance MGM101
MSTEEALQLAKAADTAAEQPPQYGRGFDGMATEPFPEATRRVLAEAINPDDVEIKPDGIVFLPGVAWRRILTRAFGAGGWAIQPRGPARVMDNIVIYPGALWCLGRFVSEAVGECFYRANNPNMSYASCVEGAKTDALSRCCKDLGHGAEMWDANWREAWKAKYAVSYQGDKWDAKSNSYKKATLWKLKARTSSPHDLMAGAGGVAPAATAPASDSTSKSAPAASGAPKPAPTAAAPASTPTASSEPEELVPAAGVEFIDTGEAASEEQKTSLKSALKTLGWKWGFMRDWFNAHFGILRENAMSTLNALTAQQADDAYLLLVSHGMANYDKVLAELRAKGSVK